MWYLGTKYFVFARYRSWKIGVVQQPIGRQYTVWRSQLSICNNNRNKRPSAELVSVIALVWQHVSTLEGNIQDGTWKYIKGIVYDGQKKICFIELKNWGTCSNRNATDTRFLQCIFHYRPEEWSSEVETRCNITDTTLTSCLDLHTSTVHFYYL